MSTPTSTVPPGRPIRYGFVCAACRADGLSEIRRFGDTDICAACAPTVVWVLRSLEAGGETDLDHLLDALDRGRRRLQAATTDEEKYTANAAEQQAKTVDE